MQISFKERLYVDILQQGIESFFSLMKTFRVSDFLDITITALIIYNCIKLIKKNRAIQLVKGILVLVVSSFIASQLKFVMLGNILNKFFEFAVITVVIVFQPELRNALEQIGRSKLSTKFGNRIYRVDETTIQEQKNCINEIVDAAVTLSLNKTGALIIFERETKLGDIIDTGTTIKAIASVPIIGNIFFNKSPLHDGAMIIKENKVFAAGCILPLTKNKNIMDHIGTRHRAALGISEISDALAVIVSEETGNISVALAGILTRNYTKEHLKNKLDDELLPKVKERKFYSQFIKYIKNRCKHED